MKDEHENNNDMEVDKKPNQNPTPDPKPENIAIEEDIDWERHQDKALYYSNRRSEPNTRK
jgi:hypothetical protein